MNRVAIVTGGNRGIGLEVARQLAEKKIKTVLTARDEKKGKAAAESLRSKGLDVVFHPLDVSSPESIDRLYDYMKKEYGRADILVNNAGIQIDSGGAWEVEKASAFRIRPDTIKQTLETNLFGPYLLSQKFIPLMKQNGYGRVVNVSSGMGQLSDMGGGWPGYRLSKVALNGLTRIFANETQGTNVLVNSASPGWVKTDMGGQEAESSVQEGADTLVWLATLEDGGPTGGFFEDRKSIPW